VLFRSWLEEELKGKKFNNAAKINPETDYGKEIFAKSVIKPNAGNINFVDFDPLLERICNVLEHHIVA